MVHFWPGELAHCSLVIGMGWVAMQGRSHPTPKPEGRDQGMLRFRKGNTADGPQKAIEDLQPPETEGKETQAKAAGLSEPPGAALGEGREKGPQCLHCVPCSSKGQVARRSPRGTNRLGLTIQRRRESKSAAPPPQERPQRGLSSTPSPERLPSSASSQKTTSRCGEK